MNNLKTIWNRGLHAFVGKKGSGKSVSLLYLLDLLELDDKKILMQERNYLDYLSELNDITPMDLTLEFRDYDVVLFDDFNQYFQNANWNSTDGKKLIQKVINFAVDTRHTNKLMVICCQSGLFSSFKSFVDSASKTLRVGNSILLRTRSNDARFTVKSYFTKLQIKNYQTVI